MPLESPSATPSRKINTWFPVGYSLQDFRHVADVMDAGHVDPKMLISSVITLDELPAMIEQLRGPNNETKVQVNPVSP